MNKEEAKQYLRIQINSCVKEYDEYHNIYYLHYNKQYLRALKLSKITVKPVNQNDFNSGDKLFRLDTKNKTVWSYSIIEDYLDENYSSDYFERINLVEEVMNEYEEYKNFKYI